MCVSLSSLHLSQERAGPSTLPTLRIRCHCTQSLTSVLSVCHLFFVLTCPPTQSSPPPHTAPRFAAPRAHVDSPLRPRDGATVSQRRCLAQDSRGLALPPPPLAARLLNTPGYSTRLGEPIVEERLFGGTQDPAFGNASRSASVIRSRGRETPRPRSQTSRHAIFGIDTGLATCNTLELRRNYDRSLRR